MNKLCQIHRMGFKVTWKLIWIGLCGWKELPPFLCIEDVLNYLDMQLSGCSQQIESIIAILCEDTADDRMRLLKAYADAEDSNNNLQMRKWRIFQLREVLDMIRDYPEGLFDLVYFWEPMHRNFEERYDIFPDYRDMIPSEFLSQENYDFWLCKNKKWLVYETQSIIEEEKALINYISCG